MEIEIMLSEEIEVKLIASVGGDQFIGHAAMVSTQGDISENVIIPEDKLTGLINFLISHRHGTPFEHSSLTFRVHAPIFCWREHHRHRIGFSYNEESGRYRQLKPVFWVPGRGRKMMPVKNITACPNCQSTSLKKSASNEKKCDCCGQTHKFHTSAHPMMGPASDDDYYSFLAAMKETYTYLYRCYQNMLDKGLAKEVARSILPVGIYSSCWVTCNPRSLMHFLSLRIEDLSATFVSHPQEEIQQIARVYEQILKAGWPITHEAFIKNGRVAP